MLLSILQRTAARVENRIVAVSWNAMIFPEATGTLAIHGGDWYKELQDFAEEVSSAEIVQMIDSSSIKKQPSSVKL